MKSVFPRSVSFLSLLTLVVSGLGCEARTSSLSLQLIVPEEAARGVVPEGPVDVVVTLSVTAHDNAFGGPGAATSTPPVARRVGTLCEGDAVFIAQLADLGLERCLERVTIGWFLSPAAEGRACGAELDDVSTDVPADEPNFEQEVDITIGFGDDDCIVNGTVEATAGQTSDLP